MSRGLIARRYLPNQLAEGLRSSHPQTPVAFSHSPYSGRSFFKILPVSSPARLYQESCSPQSRQSSHQMFVSLFFCGSSVLCILFPLCSTSGCCLFLAAVSVRDVPLVVQVLWNFVVSHVRTSVIPDAHSHTVSSVGFYRFVWSSLLLSRSCTYVHLWFRYSSYISDLAILFHDCVKVFLPVTFW